MYNNRLYIKQYYAYIILSIKTPDVRQNSSVGVFFLPFLFPFPLHIFRVQTQKQPKENENHGRRNGIR